jgi:hypothetical protein
MSSLAIQFALEQSDISPGDAMMDPTVERAQRSPFLSDPDPGQTARTVPILQPPILQTSAPSPTDPMEVTPPATATMGPPTRTSEENDTNGTHENMGMGDHTGSLAGPNAAAAAATGAQQPKVVQTAFIHKLYK